MTWAEFGTAAIGLVLGYLCISYLMSGGKPPAPGGPAGGATPDGERGAGASEGPGSGAEPAPPSSWHVVLGVPPDADASAIRDAYRRLMGQYHPDKVASLGPELRELAERKSKEITAAYREATGGAEGGE